MFGGTTVVVGLGVLAAVLLGLGIGFDVTAAAILAGIVVVGAVAIAVAHKARAGTVSPMRCPECGGLLSPHAPHCKHCGAPL